MIYRIDPVHLENPVILSKRASHYQVEWVLEDLFEGL